MLRTLPRVEPALDVVDSLGIENEDLASLRLLPVIDPFVHHELVAGVHVSRRDGLTFLYRNGPRIPGITNQFTIEEVLHSRCRSGRTVFPPVLGDQVGSREKDEERLPVEMILVENKCVVLFRHPFDMTAAIPELVPDL